MKIRIIYNYVREDNDDRLIKKLNDEIIKFQDQLALERKVIYLINILIKFYQVREETENIMFRMLEDINNKFQGEIQVDI